MIEHHDHRYHRNEDIDETIDERCESKVEIRRFLCGDSMERMPDQGVGNFDTQRRQDKCHQHIQRRV